MPLYHDRYDPAKNYERHLFHPESPLQAAELNEMQSSAHGRLRGIADALFADGDVLGGAEITVDPVSGACACGSGAIYLRGAARGVVPASLVLPTVGRVAVGVYLQQSVVTELEDPGLRDPAVAVRNSQEPGAHRLRIAPVWGYLGDGQPGDFFAVYAVEDGIVLSKAPPPNVDAIAQHVARYDRQSSGGYYVSNGFMVSRLPDEDGQQVFSMSEGEGRVNGVEVIRRHARRIRHAAAPDVLAIVLEQHVAQGGTEVVTLNHAPVWSVSSVAITKQEGASIRRGEAAGGADLLPRTSVTSVESVTYGATTYVKDVDFQLISGQIDWALGGAEPPTGVFYTVVFRYITTVVPTAKTLTGITVSGAVAGTAIQISYEWALPRFDRVGLDALGDPVVIAGVSAPRGARIPPLPAGVLGIATIHQRWDDSTQVINNAVRMVPMDELAAINRRIDTLFAFAAEERLAMNLSLSDPSSKRGLFVDPFLDDDLRDQGTDQDAAIFGGELTLGIDAAVHQQSLPDVVSLDARVIVSTDVSVGPDEVILEQLARTGTMPVNPYDSFAPMPGVAVLSPSVDFWTDFRTRWLSPVTRLFREDSWTNPATRNTWLGTFDSRNWGAFGVWSGAVSQMSRGEFIDGHTIIVNTTSAREVEIERVGERYIDAQLLRPIVVQYALSGFGAGEELRSVVFDDRQVATQGAQVADAQGRLAGSFAIPPDVPSGSKLVRFDGSATNASATFVGRGVVKIEELREVTSIVNRRLLTWNGDPLAQTLVVPEGNRRQLAAVDLWFSAVGPTNILVQIRDVALGVPTLDVVCEAILPPSEVSTTVPTRFRFPPTLLDPDREYAIVVACNDAISALHVAELGGFDAAAQRYITAQPYQIGVLASSSNNRSWTFHQTKDLWFRLIAADYNVSTNVIEAGSTRLVVPLDSVEVGNADFLLVMAAVERPAQECDTVFRLTVGDAEYEVIEGQPIALPERYSGPVDIEAELRGSFVASPRLHRDVALIVGTRRTSGTYISRAIRTGTTGLFPGVLKIQIDQILPSTSGVEVDYENALGAWVPVPIVPGSGIELGNGLTEVKREIGGIDVAETRLRVTLTGSQSALPRLRNLRSAVI